MLSGYTRREVCRLSRGVFRMETPPDPKLEELVNNWREADGEYGEISETLRKYILDKLPLFKRTEIIELLTEVDPDFYDGVVNVRPVEEL